MTDSPGRFKARLERVGLWAQRRSWKVPGFVRAAARRVLRRALPPDPESGERIVEDWSRQILGPAELPAIHEPSASVQPGPSTVALSPADLRCVIATSCLDVGGVEAVVATLAEGLPGRRIAIIVMGTEGRNGEAPGGRLVEDLRSKGVEVELVDAAGGHWLERNRPDVISAHATPDWVLAAANRLQVPFVETLHGGEFLEPDWNEEANRSAQITMLVAVSDLLRVQYLSRNANFPTDRIVTINNAVDESRHPRVAPRDARAWLGLHDEFLFVSVGRLSPQKNPYGLISAFEKVASERPEVHLLIAGRVDDPVYGLQVRDLRDRMRHSTQVHLRDHTPQIPAILAAGDAFVLDSFYEGGPIVSMEALYAGLPIVLSDVGSAPAQVGETGERGRLVANPLGDPLLVSWATVRDARYAVQKNCTELVSAMLDVVDARAEWSGRRDAIRADAAVRFGSGTFLDRHAAVLRQAADLR